jgi:hypothetical protein
MSKGETPNCAIQDRDIRLFETLYECRVMTRRHIALLLFDGRMEATKKRLRVLTSSKHLSAQRRQPNEAAVYSLTKKGFDALRTYVGTTAQLATRWSRAERRLRVSALTLQHELDVVSFRVSMVAAIRARSDEDVILEFCTRPSLIAFKVNLPWEPTITVKPDGFAHVRTRRRDGRLEDHFFFIEIDRSTESQALLLKRLAAYGEFYRRGGFARRRGGTLQDYKRYPFRVLVTCRSLERMRNLAVELAKRFRTGTQIWLTTFAESLASPLQQIWLTPSDVRASIASSTGTRAARSSSKRALFPTHQEAKDRLDQR